MISFSDFYPFLLVLFLLGSENEQAFFFLCIVLCSLWPVFLIHREENIPSCSDLLYFFLVPGQSSLPIKEGNTPPCIALLYFYLVPGQSSLPIKEGNTPSCIFVILLPLGIWPASLRNKKSKHHFSYLSPVLMLLSNS